MTHHTARVTWMRSGADFLDNRYSRGHRWHFDGGVEVPASASPEVVPHPLSVAEAVDPEEAFVAALASCHMLWFLSLAARAGFLIDEYHDDAVGVIAPDPEGRLAMTEVVLRPRVRFNEANAPTAVRHEELHREAHERCFLASSVKSRVRCEPIAIAG